MVFGMQCSFSIWKCFVDDKCSDSECSSGWQFPGCHRHVILASSVGGNNNPRQSKREILMKHTQKLISAHRKLSRENRLLKDRIVKLEEELASLRQQEVSGVWNGNVRGGVTSNNNNQHGMNNVGEVAEEHGSDHGATSSTFNLIARREKAKVALLANGFDLVPYVNKGHERQRCKICGKSRKEKVRLKDGVLRWHKNLNQAKRGVTLQYYCPFADDPSIYEMAMEKEREVQSAGYKKKNEKRKQHRKRQKQESGF